MRVDADGFARAGGARDQAVRHRRKIGDQRLTAGVFPQEKRDGLLGGRIGRELHQLFQPHFFLLLVGDFDSDRILPRHRRDDTNAHCHQRPRDIVAQSGDARDLHSGASESSYIVMTGPVSISTTCASIWNSRSACSSTAAFSRTNCSWIAA